MQTAQPDILVTTPDGEYLMLVEVKANTSDVQHAIEQTKSLMVLTGCSVGLVVSGEQVILLRDSLEKFDGESIAIVGSAQLPESLLPASSVKSQEASEFELASRVQQWLEKLPFTAENLPYDLQQLFSEPILNLLRFGEVRSAGPRWSRVAR